MTVVTMEVDVDLSDLEEHELKAECDVRGIETRELSEYTSMELADELRDRGEWLPELNPYRLWEWVRDVPNVPADIRDMVCNATGRILP